MAQKYSKKSQSEPIEVKIVVAIFRALWWLISWPFKGLLGGSAPKARRASSLDSGQVAKRWADIQTSIGLGGVTHFGSAVVAADKLLDYVLRQKGYPGETMGERLREAQGDLSPAVYHNVWQAHKLRNQLVHEVESEVVSFQAKEAIKSFEHALRELGALR
jgi:hypothetical protein